MIHIDIKTLGRFTRLGKHILGPGPGRHARHAGSEAVTVSVDDATRLAYIEVLADARAAIAVTLLHRAVAWLAEHDIEFREVMTDNGSAYVSDAWAIACQEELRVKHLRTPNRPRTNGKAERFIQSLLRECAYGKIWQSSAARCRGLPTWLRYYNLKRPHGSLGHKPLDTGLAA